MTTGDISGIPSDNEPKPLTTPPGPSENSSISGEKILTGSSPFPLLCDGNHDSSTSAPKISKARRILLCAVMMCATALNSTATISVLILIPSIAKDLEQSELAIQWVASAYSLANGCGMLVAGRFADLYGRKYLVLFGLSVLCIVSLISGFVRDRAALCVLRGIAGVGAAFALPACFGIVAVTFSEEPGRTIAFAILGLGYPVGGAIGQVIGGILAGTGRHGWQYQFFLVAGVALPTVVVAAIVIPTEPPKSNITNRRVDWVGAGIITTALSLFSFSVTQGGLVEGGWTNAYIPLVFVLSLSLIVLFGIWEHYVRHHTTLPPLINLAIFSRHDWKVTAVLLAVMTAIISNGGWVYLTTIWYQDYKNETPLENVLHVLTAPIVGIAACVTVPIVAPRVRAPILIFFGGFATAASNWLYAIKPESTTYWANEFISNIVTPFGADYSLGIGSVLISNLASEDEQSLLGALLQTTISLGGTITTCLCSLVQTVVKEQTGDLQHALKVGFWMAAGFGWLSCLITLLTLRNVGLAKDVAKSQ